MSDVKEKKLNVALFFEMVTAHEDEEENWNRCFRHDSWLQNCMIARSSYECSCVCELKDIRWMANVTMSKNNETTALMAWNVDLFFRRREKKIHIFWWIEHAPCAHCIAFIQLDLNHFICFYWKLLQQLHGYVYRHVLSPMWLAKHTRRLVLDQIALDSINS